MKNKMNIIGMITLIFIFTLFYLIANFFLGQKSENKTTIDNNDDAIVEDSSYDKEEDIVNKLYNDVKILYDVVNNKFKVDQENVIIIGDITYKKITNFDEVMNNLFTEKGIKKYIDKLNNYFAYTENGYYLAGNLVSYQTYYFRGDDTNIYITSADDNEINGIIYERWTSNNKNTLATIKVINENGTWLIDDITILSTK